MLNRILPVLLLAAVALTAGPVAAWHPPQPGAMLESTTPFEAEPDTFIVLLEGEPLAGYRGGVPGLAPTSPTVTGDAALDTGTPASVAYLDHLTAVQDQALAAIEAVIDRPADVDFRYQYASNGFAVQLSPDEAARVAKLPGVFTVEPNTPRLVDTDAGPAWIGAPAVWDGSATGSEVGTMGEGMVVGVIDTGINMDHPSFAEVDERGYEHVNPKGKFLGFCDPDSNLYDTRFICNDKLIGVYSFVTVQSNRMNPEDDNGHGSHTASTAAGNFVTTNLEAPTTTIERTFSGVAPHANIVAYDACYSNQNGQGVCPPAGSLMALDQAVKDGVDAVNFSIASSQNSPWIDSHHLAFKRIREAGIIAAVSAGNSGPGAATTAAIAPWEIAVGATSHNRVFANRLFDMSGGDSPPSEDIDGRGLTGPYGPAPIVYAGDGNYKNSDGDVDDGKCLVSFPSRTFDGEIVVCDRGDIARVQKGANVLAGGAGGLVLANRSAEGASINGDGHDLPAVHITYADARVLKAWLERGTGHTASIGQGDAGLVDEVADIVTGFSSRGPTVSAFCCRRPGLDITVPQLFSVLKPDVAAPGIGIIAAYNTDGNRPEPEFESAQGTSMSSPHVAGTAALLRSAHPDWTPAEIQSALMTTAITEGVLKEDAATPADWFDQGAGRVDVGRAAAAGIVLDITKAEYDAADPGKGGDPRTLNLPSLTDTECLDTCTWTRTVRSPLDRAVEWSADSVGAMPVTVTPAQFTLGPGESRSVAFEADATSLARGNFAFGDVILWPSDEAVPSAHFPVTVMPVESILPPLKVIQTLEPQGSDPVVGLRAGEISELVTDVHGLVKADITDMSLNEDESPSNRFNLDDSTEIVTFDVPRDAVRVVAEVTASEASDVDLFMGIDANGDEKPQQNEMLCNSLSDGWAEFCELTDAQLPAPGTYWVVVQNFTGSDDQPDDITLATAVVLEDDEGNLAVTGPTAVPYGQPFDLQMTWDLPDLATGDRWFGAVDLGSSPSSRGDIGRVMVDVVGDEAPPATATPPLTPTPTDVPPTAVPTDVPPTVVPTDAPPTATWHVFLPRVLRRVE